MGDVFVGGLVRGGVGGMEKCVRVSGYGVEAGCGLRVGDK